MKLYRKKYKLIETYGVFLVDLAAIAIAYFAGRFLRMRIPLGPAVTEETVWFPVYSLCILGCILFNFLRNKYQGFFARGYFVEAEEVAKYNVWQFVFLSTCVYLFRLELDFSRLMLVYFVICNSVIDYLFRILFKAFIIKNYKKGKGSEKILIVTNSELLPRVREHILRDQGWNYEVVGVSLTDISNAADVKAHTVHTSDTSKEPWRIVSGRDDLIEIARQMPIDLVFFCCDSIGSDGKEKSFLEETIQSFILMGVRCYYGIQGFQFQIPSSGFGEFAEFPVICYNTVERDWRMSVVKRLTDILGGIIGLIITGILLPFIAMAIKLEDPKGTVFFSQTRIGKNGRRFQIYKFRSMYANAEERKKELMGQNEVQGPMFKLANDPRVTKVGKFLRRTSLDELPQFWNIFKGDMSLVGTRPPIVEEFEQYNDYYRRRMSITPGLTGLWQVSGRSDIKDFNEVVKLDLQYIDNWSIGQDVKILLQTIGVVLKGTGSK